MMDGVEKALTAIARDIWDNGAEDRKHLADIMAGKTPADALYTVKLMDEVHRLTVTANRIQLERFKADWAGVK